MPPATRITAEWLDEVMAGITAALQPSFAEVRAAMEDRRRALVRRLAEREAMARAGLPAPDEGA